tara:strand:- start:480 stop:695 length:216 start_codon:yes stop_codon:yes gene_type:complete
MEELAKDYEGLERQYLALRSIVNAKERTLAKANERVKELEQAIVSNCYDDPSTSGKRLMALVSEQLRKEQE